MTETAEHATTSRKTPFWALAALSLLPLWAFMYVRALTPATASQPGPLALGADVYNGCATCHGPQGQGGVGRPLDQGAVVHTFPHIEDHLRFVSFGTEAYSAAGVTVYGDPARPGGAHVTGSFGIMPQQGAAAGGGLTDAEILAVVCHERYVIGGADRSTDRFADEFATWCSTESPVYAALEAGVALADLDEADLTDGAGDDIEVLDIGDAPAPGRPAD